MPAVRSSATELFPRQSTVTVPKPTGTLQGDLLVFIVATEDLRGITWPTGFTELFPTRGDAGVYVGVAWAWAGSAEPASYLSTFSSATEGAAAVWAITDATDLPIAGPGGYSSAGSVVASSVDVPSPNALLLASFSFTHFESHTFSPPPGMVEQYDIWNFGAEVGLLGAKETLASSGPSGDREVSSPYAGVAFLLAVPGNNPPNAPIPTTPTDGATVNRANPITLRADFSDPDPSDSPSASEWRYRLGTASWTTAQQPNTLQSYTIPAGLVAGDYEWQSRYADQAGKWGPFCASAFFTAGDPPPGPTWLDPIEGQIVGTASYTGSFSAADVDESEWRLVADNAGVIDESTIVQGPTLKATGDLRSHTWSGLANGVPVWWQVRVKYGGLWGPWASVRTPVSYTPPPEPVVSLLADNTSGSLAITITNPAPTGEEPAAVYNDVEIDDGDGWVRVATMVAINGIYTYWLPRAGRDYGGNVRVTAVAENGVTAATTTTSTTEPPVEGFYGGY